MDKEVKANLIFMAVLTVLLAPGAVMLAVKKYNDPGSPMAMPKPVRHQAAYNDPLSRSAWVERVVPAATAAWIRGEADARLEPLRDVEDVSESLGWFGGAVSEKKTFELAGVLDGGSKGGGDQDVGDRGGGRVVVLLLTWDERMADGVVWIAGKRAVKLAKDRVELPLEIRHDLQDVGYVLPPQWVVWVTAELAEAVLLEGGVELAVEAEVEVKGETKRRRDVLVVR